MDYENIGNQIKIERERQHLTQSTLAEKAGISTTHLSNIERGATKLSIESFVGIASALRVSADKLLNRNIDSESAKVSLSQEIQDLLEDCTHFELSLISDIIQTVKKSVRNKTVDA